MYQLKNMVFVIKKMSVLDSLRIKNIIFSIYIKKIGGYRTDNIFLRWNIKYQITLSLYSGYNKE